MQQHQPLLEELLEAGTQHTMQPLLEELLEAGAQQRTTQQPLLLEELLAGQQPLLLEELLEAAPQDENGAHA
jgi:hypothetical protein